MTIQSTSEPERPSRRNPLALRRDRFSLATLGLATIILLGLLAPLIAPHDPNATNLLQRSLPPGWNDAGSWAHPFGTDAIGRDLMSRVLYGIRTSFGIAAIGLVFSAVLGIGIGVVAGLAGPIMDRVLMTIVDVFIPLPNLLLMLCGIALLGTEIWVLVLMIGLVKWEGHARLVREQGYVEAARTLGAGLPHKHDRQRPGRANAAVSGDAPCCCVTRSIALASRRFP